MEKVASWIRSLDLDSVRGIRVCLGSAKQNLSTVAIVGFADLKVGKNSEIQASKVEDENHAALIDAVTDALRAGGYPDFEHYRLYALTIQNKQLTSCYGRSHRDDTLGTGNDSSAMTILAAAVSKMAQANISMCAEQTRALQVVSNALEHREDKLTEAFEAVIESRSNEIEMQAKVYDAIFEKGIAEAVMEAAEDGGDDDGMKAEALDMFKGILDQLGIMPGPSTVVDNAPPTEEEHTDA